MPGIERYLPVVFLVGLGLVAAGYVLVVVAGFRQRAAWGVGLLVFPPLGPVFAWKHPRRGLAPLAVLALGLVATAAPPLYTRLTPVDLGPRERVVDGERHLTLTGWDRSDYTFLRSKRDAVVIQMANPDVDDSVLQNLRGMDRLRELDLSGTVVSDAGLAGLVDLPKLETLRLRGTRVTDAGVQGLLDGITGLKQLDVRETGVSRELVQRWRSGASGRRALR